MIIIKNKAIQTQYNIKSSDNYSSVCTTTEPDKSLTNLQNKRNNNKRLTNNLDDTVTNITFDDSVYSGTNIPFPKK